MKTFIEQTLENISLRHSEIVEEFSNGVSIRKELSPELLGDIGKALTEQDRISRESEREKYREIELGLYRMWEELQFLNQK